MSDPSQANTPSQTVAKLSIPEIANGWSGSLVNEDPADKKHRLEQEAYDACHKRWRLNIIILVAILGLCFVFYLCFLTLTDTQASTNDKRWATAFVSSIVSGSIGFLTGKAVS